MNIAVLGNAGREHALIWKLSQFHNSKSLFFLPGNPGFEGSYPVNISNFEEVKKFCENHKIELLIVGPEAPLTDGIADFFEGTNIKVFGPKKQAAMLESSKRFAKEFMKRNKIPTAPYWSFESIDTAYPFVEHLDGKVVLKYDGLASGKGVIVCNSVKEATAALSQFKEKWGNTCPFLIEEPLKGWELSLIGITDGNSITTFPFVKDHKRALENDQGPNTGGMGAFTPVPEIDSKTEESIHAQIVNPTIKGLKAEGIPYIGFIYFGLMITDEGPKLLEYNVRMGDPEAEVLLPSLESDLLELILACFDGTLSEIEPIFSDQAIVDVVLTSSGYPGPYPTSIPIKNTDQLSSNTLLFHAGTKWKKGQLVTSGGRVLNVVGKGSTLEEAKSKAYIACETILFQGKRFRSDIAEETVKST